jgi:UDP-N-acetylglucosamine--N-acetylmuramyl-(pentapeptide) pyrophosphoryl-undecaprenol N-acetylglucosamine transferase
MLAGGGTGGHVFPGLALAEELRSAEPGIEVVFVGARGGMEEALVSRAGWPIETVASVKPGGLTGLLRLAVVGPLALAASLRLIRRFRPDVVVALGGYAACAPALAAALAGVPLVVLEQNAIPGRVSRLLARFAREVHATYPESVRFFARPELVRVSGNPVRPALLAAAARPGKMRSPGGPVRLLCMGGSQGARRLNSLCLEAVSLLGGRARGRAVECVLLAGPGNMAEAERGAAAAGGRVKVVAFDDDMAARYAWADLVIARAGATGLAELAAFGLPAILVPFPFAADNHQEANARCFERAGAAVVLTENGLEGARLADEVAGLIDGDGVLANMAGRMKGMGRPEAGRSVAARLLALAGGPAG